MSSIIKVDTVQDQDGNNIINENANTITIGASGDTITIPSGATLANNGTATGFASIDWQSSIVTAATLTAVAGNGYWINTTSNACTITLPASASVGDQIIFSDYLRTWGTNAVTINPNSLNFQGNTTPQPIYNTNGQSVDIVYSGATQGWIPTVDDDVTLETPQTYSVDFLVIAGGAGGGGRYYSGGGGAGGYRTSTQTIDIGTSITVTVGDGGAGGSGTNVRGTNGSNSLISGTGLTTITSAGGGGGGAGGGNPEGLDGGSGGGASGYDETGSKGGDGNTPSTSPSQGNGGGGNTGVGQYGGGGGGGAGAVGVTSPGPNGANGGVGTASSITGSSVTRAGGGGGAAYSPGSGTKGFGGTGGGGDGGQSSTDATAGTVNTGGGGGGADGDLGSDTGAAGGKGVVILSMPLAKFSGTTTGSPTEATSGSNKILTFTGDGSYTA